MATKKHSTSRGNRRNTDVRHAVGTNGRNHAEFVVAKFFGIRPMARMLSQHGYPLNHSTIACWMRRKRTWRGETYAGLIPHRWHDAILDVAGKEMITLDREDLGPRLFGLRG
jgi:hypothetical protein